MYKHFLCVCRTKPSGKDVVSFTITKPFKEESSRQVLINSELEYCYDKFERIDKEIQQVKDGISSILDMNYKKHLNTINHMMKRNIKALDAFKTRYDKKLGYDKSLNKFTELYQNTRNIEKQLTNNMENLLLKKCDDMSEEQVEKQLEHNKNKLEQIKKNKVKILENVVNITTKKDNISLTLDKIFFDNIV
eukprot:Pgem_evm1s12948